jgi:hypothetical protein
MSSSPIHMRTIFLLVSLSACGPSYEVRHDDWLARRSSSTIPAQNEAGDPVQLRTDKLENARVVEHGDRLRGRQATLRYRLSLGFLAAGTVLSVAAITSFLSILAPCEGDERCWLPQTITGATLGSFSGLSFIVGTALFPSALGEAEAPR